MIGTLAGARAKGATGDDATVTAALVAAALRVHTYCRDQFEPTTDTRSLTLATASQMAVAPVRLRGVTAVVSGSTTLPAPAYRLVPTEGMVSTDPDYLGIEVATRGGDGTIVGAEPWNGGWSNLYDTSDPVLTVTGLWGWASTPLDVVWAVESLAAGQEAPAPYVPQADAEGNPVGRPDPDDVYPNREPVQSAGRSELTTGDAEVDRVLAPFRRMVPRMT